MGSGKTTSFDIAHLAGVSQATVSRALRNSPLVNPETRERIKKIAREQNYRVDRNAAGLRSQRSNTLALLLSEDPTSDDSQINPFFLSMLGNITRYAAARQYDVLVSFQQLREDWLYDYEVSNRADGIILLASMSPFGTEVLSAKSHRALPIVIGCETISPELTDFPSVHIDNVAAAKEATAYLVSQGHERIGLICGRDSNCKEASRCPGDRDLESNQS